MQERLRGPDNMGLLRGSGTLPGESDTAVSVGGRRRGAHEGSHWSCNACATCETRNRHAF
eukprot:1848399-Prymnesium_polylepis.1